MTEEKVGLKLSKSDWGLIFSVCIIIFLGFYINSSNSKINALQEKIDMTNYKIDQLIATDHLIAVSLTKLDNYYTTEINRTTAFMYNIQNQRLGIIAAELNITDVPIPDCMNSVRFTLDKVYKDGAFYYIRRNETYDKHIGHMFLKANNDLTCFDFNRKEVPCEDFCKEENK